MTAIDGKLSAVEGTNKKQGNSHTGNGVKGKADHSTSNCFGGEYMEK